MITQIAKNKVGKYFGFKAVFLQWSMCMGN